MILLTNLIKEIAFKHQVDGEDNPYFIDKNKKLKIKHDDSVSAILLYPDNNRSEAITPKNGKKFTLEEFQELVNGYIDIIDITNETSLIFNEEGEIRGLPKNDIGTALYSITKPPLTNIYGKVIICSKKYIE